MGNDATVELSPVAGRNVLSIRSGNPAFVAQAQQAFPVLMSSNATIWAI